MMKFVSNCSIQWTLAATLAATGLTSIACAQSESHGRKYKAAPATAHIVVTVEKAFNSKPMPNAAVVFHAVRNGENDGNLEVKTDPDGKATIDVIEIGSKVTVQVIANGFATYAQDVDIDSPNKELLVKMLRPRAQVSEYVDNDGKASPVKPGVQEPPHPVAPQSVVPPAVTPQAVVPEAAPPATSPSSPK